MGYDCMTRSSCGQRFDTSEKRDAHERVCVAEWAVELVRAMDSDERDAFLSAFKATFCIHCGIEDPWCRCCDDS